MTNISSRRSPRLKSWEYVTCNRLKGDMTHEEYKIFIKSNRSLRDIGMIRIELGEPVRIIPRSNTGNDRIRGMSLREQTIQDNQNLDRVLKNG